MSFTGRVLGVTTSRQPAYLLAAALACSAPFLIPARAEAQTVAAFGWEDGGTDGWGVFGSGTLSNSTAAAHTGTHSLLITNRTASFNGPSLSVTSLLSPGTTYQISAWAELTTGEPADTLKITIMRTTNGAQAFDTVATSASGGVTGLAFTQLQGTYTVPAGTTAMLMYIEAANATNAYFVDDVGIVQLTASGCSNPPDNTGIHTNFDDGTAQGWTSRTGVEVVTVTNADAHSPPFSLLTTGRAQPFQGPSINATGKLCNGSRYVVSVWVKLGPTATQADTLRVSLQRTLAGVTSFATVVGNTAVPLGQWVHLSATIDFAFNYDVLSLYVESNSLLQDFYIDDFDVSFLPPIQIEQNIPSVFQTYAAFFPIGSAIFAGDLTGPHAQLLIKHFDSITSENDMKWDATEPQENNFTFAAADAQVAFAKANGMRIRGHNLVWTNQIPAWVFLEPDGVTPLTPGNAADRQLLVQRVQNHIQNVVTHFGTDVYAWDVVNEPIDATQPDCLLRNNWYNIVGPDYLDLAFQFAHQANPSAELFVNEFNTTTDPRKTCLFNVVQGLLQRGVPINAVGHEMHSNLEFPPVQSLVDTVNQFAGLGIDQQVTELDISIYFGSNPTLFDDYSLIPTSLLIQQGYLYRDFLQALKQLKGKISSVTFWGMADDHTFLTTPGRVDAPLLFDINLQHKFAYTGIIDPLDLPGANLVTTVTATPGTVLSGHPVSYAITVTNKGPNDAANPTLTDALPAATTFQSVTAPPGWTCTAPAVGGTGQLSCTAPSLSSGATALFTLVVNLACATPNGTSITDTATVTSTTANPNPTPQNSASVNVLASDPPPVISGLKISKPVLWPPDHKLVPETLFYSVAATCDPSPALAVSVASNQPVDAGEAGDDDADARHDDHRDVDWIVLDPHHLLLRAEREGRKARIYTVTVTATDSAGSSGSSSVKVTVPLHR